MKLEETIDLFQEHQKIRAQFPILDSVINDNKLVYLDNAATTHKPSSVINAVANFEANDYGTVRRGVYDLSVNATQAFDQARSTVQNFINAKSSEEIIFTRGTTESINLVAFSLLEALKGNLSNKASNQKNESNLATNDDIEILFTEMEHHANMVPWQIQANRLGLKTNYCPVLDNGELDLETLYKQLEKKQTRVLAITHVSNTLGSVNPIREIIAHAHKNNVIVLVDGAQAISHLEVDVQDIDADFYVFSAHKLYAPSGIGVLYGKKELLEQMPPYHGGGEMINLVQPQASSFAQLPFKFEAGTPAISQAIGLSHAIEFVKKIGLKQIATYENYLYKEAYLRIKDIEQIKFIGMAENKTAILSFVFDDIEAFDIGTMLNQYGVAIRTGHHCTQPLMQRYNISASSRASFAFYNNLEDIEFFADKLKKAIKIFR